MAKKKNEAKVDIDLFNYIKDNKKYRNSWTVRKTDNKYIQECLNIASKKGSQNRGEPDFIYINEAKKLLILIENKDSIQNHISKEGKSNPSLYAVDGIKHYLSFFITDKIKKETTKKYLKNWSIIGIAFSGDINDEYNHLISTFILSQNIIKNIETNEILNEDDYTAFFENIDLEFISKNITKSSSEINRMLRALDSQKRPILLSALMICLYDKGDYPNDFKSSYSNWNTNTIINNIPPTIKEILKLEEIDDEKINVLINEITFIKTDNDLTSSSILKDILTELEINVIPLFNKKTNYDIIGKFYEEFLRYAGVTNVKKGIVLTPNHITKLFTEIIDIKTNDVIFDICCGTGAFLIAGMNKLITEIENSKLADKRNRISKVKQNQLIGFEKSSTMYSLAISNMLFRGDGKSRIFNIDAFSDKAKLVLSKLKKSGIRPSIGFINPPFGGQDNQKNPTKKEIQFLEKMLDNVSRYGIIIAPLSMYFNDEIDRNRILSKHTLKLVINMPYELFQPNAMTHTAIAVFETNSPHNHKKVILYNIKEDGLVLSKNRGRTDVLNRWIHTKNDLIVKLKHPEKYPNDINLVNTSISENDEWIIQAHSKFDINSLNNKSFENTIRENIIFSTKHKLGILNKDIDAITFSEILKDSKVSEKPVSNSKVLLNKNKWIDFKIGGENGLFDIQKGERLTEIERESGSVPLITASSYNNGITSFIDLSTFQESKKLFENRITVDMFCNVFYHDYQYFSDDNIHTLLFKNTNYIKYYENKFVNLFLVTIIKNLQNKYDFGRQVRLKRLENEFIKLPATKKGEPDFKFMQRYMESLAYSSAI